MGRNSASNGSRRAAFHSDKSTRHLERKLLSTPVEDRWVTAPAPKVVRAQNKPAAAPKHPNAERVQGLNAGKLRDHYRALFGQEPGQMGKDRLLQAFLRPGAPPIPA